MLEILSQIQNRLFELQDKTYRDFNAKLIPTVDSKTIIGVRTPQLRKLAKELFKHPNISEFLNTLPHTYYEENNLHAFLIEQIRDYDACVLEIDRFLPYIDNWATCDSLSPKVLKKKPDRLIDDIRRWMASNHTYTVRFGIEMLMRFFLDDAFSSEYTEMVAKIDSEDYYVKMMIAWYFATALAKQYDAVLPYFETPRLSAWIHNRAIQKARESYRVSEEKKAYLRTLKIDLS